MGWIILIAAVVLLFVGLARSAGSEHTGDRGDPEQRAVSDDDQMLEDWYASQELDNDLDDWDQ